MIYLFIYLIIGTFAAFITQHIIKTMGVDTPPGVPAHVCIAFMLGVSLLAWPCILAAIVYMLYFYNPTQDT